ncbi:leucine-rich repeat-containing protein [Verticillium alfalfae VaMs.102]|uniref:Leucine-rich repeat-containing protein n=1 Tax=Verticillium alfalfae (strain VaMs.102 / ATCC MYA-4576 / FGSC 10136) TaxID=526221 RepID=C9SWV0_VERA1|nr:leucine-rich repeat-containing protein [Verticillium alfalfae VaMs.102]EEY23491.1 leucine-rich repeat-containing protein [Verticillium alfalfae VaMs.102]
MEEKPAAVNRQSAIPRMSRLPTPRSTSSSNLRPAASKENLNPVPKQRLRPAASRDQLPRASSISSNRVEPREALATTPRPRRDISAARPRATVSRPSLAASTTPTHSPSQTPSSHTPTGDPPADPDHFLFKKPTALTRRPSEARMSTPSDVTNQSPVDSDPSVNDSTDGMSFGTIRPRSSKPRPSLSERTMETLAQLPSSPAMSKKSTSFFDPDGTRRSRSRAGSNGSRPGSSYTSDGSMRPPSQAKSRPGSSSGPDDGSVSSFRASTNTFRQPLTTIEARPTNFAASTIGHSFDRGSSPTKSTGIAAPPKIGAKTIAARPLKQRQSINGLFKKPSLPAMDRTAAAQPAPPKFTPKPASKTISTPSRLTKPPRTIAKPGAIGAASEAIGKPDMEASRKSSTALREQIAQAKAAKRAAAKKAPDLDLVPDSLAVTDDPKSFPLKSPIVPADNSFDFGIAVTHDPFNTQRTQSAKNKIVQQRLGDARNSGRLNIAAMGLSVMPVEVLKMQLRLLTSLNLVISQLTSLRDLKLANNLLYGPLDPSVSNLQNLEIFDIHGNNVSTLPTNFGNLERLRILNLAENSFELLPFGILSQMPLTELNLKKNKLAKTLIEDDVEALSKLQSIDISCNQITHIVAPGTTVSLPVLYQLSASMNRLKALPDVSSWSSLLTLTADENSISEFPEGFFSLEKLRHVDFSANDIRIIPPEIARMDNLAMIRLSGNPLRDKKFISATTEELKDALAARLEPPPPYDDVTSTAHTIAAAIADDAKASEPPTKEVAPEEGEHDSRSDMDDFATPPDIGAALTCSIESSSLHPVVCSKIAAATRVTEIQLHHNLFATFPESLTFFANTLTALSLAHNKLVGETYLPEELELPALRELNLMNNHITSLTPLTVNLRSQQLEKVDVSLNRITALPTDLRIVFPQLSVMLIANNHLIELDPESIRGLQVVDANNNDIAHLNPKIGLLGGNGGLRQLDVSGNRFRVPRFSVLERGTDATLRWLRGRVPVAEMASWKEGQGEGGLGDSDDDVD